MSYNRPPNQNSYYQQPGYGYPGYNQPPPSQPAQPQYPGYGYPPQANNSAYPGYGQQTGYNHAPAQYNQPSYPQGHGYNYQNQQQQQQQQQPPHGNYNVGPSAAPNPGAYPTPSTSHDAAVKIRGLSSYEETYRAVDSQLNPSSSYRVVQQTVAQIAQTLFEHRTLAATWTTVQNPATYNQSDRIITILGVLPITFRNNTYNIPVTIYLPRAFPTECPYPLVTPTDNMRVTPNNQFVQANGKVIIDYFTNWTSSYSLSEACNLMKSAFSVAPPVYAVPAGTPDPTPKPQTSTYQPTQGSTSYSSGPSTTSQHGTSTHPTMPNYTANTGYSQSSSSSYSQYQPQNTQSQHQHQHQHQPIQPPQPDPAEVKRQQMRALSDALAVKTNFALSQLSDEATRTINETVSAHEKLATSKVALQASLKSKKKLLVEVQAMSQKLSLQASQLESWLHDNENKEPQIESVVLFENPLSEQLLQSVAEDNALDETLAEFTRLAIEGQIPFTDFVKETRRLARQQFMARALSQKIETMI